MGNQPECETLRWPHHGFAETETLTRVETVIIPELFLVFIFWSIWPLIGGYVATQKRRSIVEGILLGLLGPLGVIIEALLPTISANTADHPRPSR